MAGATSLVGAASPNSDCLTCHEDQSLTETKAQGKVISLFVDGKRLAASVHGSNACASCHRDITPQHPDDNVAAQQPVCVSCHPAQRNHEKAAAQYSRSIHGFSRAMGGTAAASCGHCHGSHDILPQSNPLSRLSKQNIVGTCRKCHPGANASFTEYDPHADPLDRQHYPALYWTFVGMTTLLVGVFTFFGAHTGFWLFRSGYLYLHDSKTFREAKISAQKGGEWFTRFGPHERFLHMLVVTSFLLLVSTGMPLKFYYTPWAKAMYNLLGGADVARALHHFGALVTLLYFGLHLCGLGLLTWRRRGQFRDPATGRLRWGRIREVVWGPESMVPTVQDIRDFVAHQKWFFGKGPKPQFDRWTYWEKFDYFAVFWGSSPSACPA